MIPADAMREAVEAACRANGDSGGHAVERWGEEYAMVLAAALPIIETAVRAQVAREIAEALSVSECGERASRREDPDMWAELDARRRRDGIPIPLHEPDGYAPYCDGCASARAANQTRTEVLKLVTHGPELARDATTTPSAGTDGGEA